MQWSTKLVWAAFVVVCAPAIFLLSVFLFVPPPGTAVAVLGALAIWLTLVPPKEPSRQEKAFWVGCAFFLMLIEIVAITHDRKQQHVNFQQIVNGLTAAINVSTGGDEFCFLVPIPPYIGAPPTPPGRWPLYVSSSGTVPLPFCDVRIIGTDISDAQGGRFTYLE